MRNMIVSLIVAALFVLLLVSVKNAIVDTQVPTTVTPQAIEEIDQEEGGVICDEGIECSSPRKHPRKHRFFHRRGR